MHFESLPTSYRTRKVDPFFVVDRILRHQKEARAAAESKAKENQNTVYPLHPSGAGINQLSDSGSHAIPLQHESSQATDKLGRIPNSSTSIADTFQSLRQKMSSMSSTQLEKLTTLGQGTTALASSQSLITPSNPENLDTLSAVEHNAHTPLAISKTSSPARSPSVNPPVTPLSHICASIVIGCAFITLKYKV